MKALLLIFCCLSAVFSPVSAQDLTLYGRGIYPGDDSTFASIKKSGFNTFILSSFYIKSNGDVFSGDDGKDPIIHDGKYVGKKEWLDRIASLRKGKTSVKRIEILLEGRWYNQPPNTYDFISDWTKAGRGGDTLTNIIKVFKNDLGVDAVCIDDESVYDAPSIVALGKMVGALNLHMTLCPFTKMAYWKAILDGAAPGLIDAIYLQCYDGGARAVPGDWVKGLATELPVYPIFLCRGAFNTCATDHNSKSPEEIQALLKQWRKDYPTMSGGAIWQVADIKSYVNMDCAVKDPSSGTARSFEEYISQLKSSLEKGLK